MTMDCPFITYLLAETIKSPTAIKVNWMNFCEPNHFLVGGGNNRQMGSTIL